ncbi:hypothetical protein QC762_501660 [Podospora pseudocomata]|uniref:Uncharacterized protein n=1 Tax=Podospora pseudocomata TaxID=2093779 RepID=A0ABR0GA24_9PEZI|nr:hypothetical protein QC762_501660 [Podospora pseudocomata]
MDQPLGSFVPPYLISFPTNTVSFIHVGPQSEWHRQQRPDTTLCRRASKGHLSVYCNLEKDQSHVLLAISFQEDDLPSLNRQVYYHYVDKDDSIIGNGTLIEITFQNYPEDIDTADRLKNSIAWRIHFNKKHMDAIKYILTQARSQTANLPRVAALPKEDRDLLYHYIRATLIPQPVPHGLAALGKWPIRLPTTLSTSPSLGAKSEPVAASVYHDAAQDQVVEDTEEEAPKAIRLREMERERYANKPPPSPPPPRPASPSPWPARSKNNHVPGPSREDEEYYQSVIDAATTPKKPELFVAAQDAVPTLTPVGRGRRAEEEDAFWGSPLGKPGQMASRKKGGLAPGCGGATERKVSMQALVGNAEVEVRFKEKDADKVLKAMVPKKVENSGDEFTA